MEMIVITYFIIGMITAGIFAGAGYEDFYNGKESELVLHAIVVFFLWPVAVGVMIGTQLITRENNFKKMQEQKEKIQEKASKKMGL